MDATCVAFSFRLCGSATGAHLFRPGSPGGPLLFRGNFLPSSRGDVSVSARYKSFVGCMFCWEAGGGVAVVFHGIVGGDLQCGAWDVVVRRQKSPGGGSNFWVCPLGSRRSFSALSSRGNVFHCRREKIHCAFRSRNFSSRSKNFSHRTILVSFQEFFPSHDSRLVPRIFPIARFSPRSQNLLTNMVIRCASYTFFHEHGVREKTCMVHKRSRRYCGAESSRQLRSHRAESPNIRGIK